MQIPIWSWIQEQYKFDFIQMVSLILCRNNSTCMTPPSGDTTIETQITDANANTSETAAKNIEGI